MLNLESRKFRKSKKKQWRSQVRHLPHHHGAVLGAVSVRVLEDVVVASHHFEGLVGTLTCCWPEKVNFFVV